MTHHVRRATNLAFAFILAVLSINLTGVMTVNDAYADNNGTLKVHEKGTESDTESNDPKVCAFNFEGFQFDAGQTGLIKVEPQGGNPGTTDTVDVPFGPANASGYAQTAYVNDGTGLSLDNGHYKSTLYGKDIDDTYTIDLKAKSKVFKVECATPPALITVTADIPAQVDLCAASSDTYTIPSKTGVIYKVNNIVKAAGTYAGSGTVSITAVADQGYVLQGTASWTFTFNSSKCNVTPITPSKVDVCGRSNDTYTIPVTAGVTYKVNGVTKSAGTYAGSGLTVITATAQTGFELQGTKVWTYIFTNLPCPVTPAAPTKIDVCGHSNDTYTIPVTAGVNYYVNGHYKAAGTYTTSSDVIIVAVPQSGLYIPLGTKAIWVFDFSGEKCPEPCVTHAPALTVRSLNFFNHHNDDDEDCIPVEVPPTTPTSVDECGVYGDKYTIPSKAGVIYKVNGVITPAGTYNAEGASIVITAVAANNYALTGTASWTLSFTDVSCPTPDISVTAECSQQGVLVTLKNDGDGDGYAYVGGAKVTVLAGETVEVIVPYILFKASVVVYDEYENKLIDRTFDCTPGQGNTGESETPVTTTPPAVTTPAVRAASTTPALLEGLMLPETGGNPATSILTTLAAGLITYGAMFYLINRRDLFAKK